jgi:hypothetical protein
LAPLRGATIISRVSDEKNPVEVAVEQAVELWRDLFVYAPIGLLFEGPALLPTLIERGKNQVATARVVGKYAARQGQAEVAKRLANRRSPASGPARTAPTPTAAARPAASTARSTPRPRSTPEAAAVLAIPDYDSLSASQVVNRLAGLASDELEAVRSYEGGHRGRKTILNKIAQLQG